MMVENKSSHFLGVLGFALLLLVPSVDTVLKYFGATGIAVYIAAGTAAIFFCRRFAVAPFLAKIGEKQALVLGALTILILIVIATVGYPLANSGAYGPGGDVDDAMIAAARSVASGHYPYYERTYLGLLISPMPGAIFLAIPFVLVNALIYQNIFWLGVFFVAVKSQFKSAVVALGVLWTVLLISPTVYHGLVTGSDYVSNSIYIIIGMWFMVKTIGSPDAAFWKKLLPAMLLGIGLSSRSNFLLLMPLFFSVLVQNAPSREAIKYLFISFAVFMLVTVPFWLYDPAGFAPLIAQSDKVRGLEALLPHAGLIIPGSTFLLTMVLAFQKMERDCGVFFRNCAIVQLFVLLFTSIVFAVQAGKLNLYMSHAGYGMFVLFFAVLAAWITMLKQNDARDNVEV